jgi:hypothetical protein
MNQILYAIIALLVAAVWADNPGRGHGYGRYEKRIHNASSRTNKTTPTQVNNTSNRSWKILFIGGHRQANDWIDADMERREKDKEIRDHKQRKNEYEHMRSLERAERMRAERMDRELKQQAAYAQREADRRAQQDAERRADRERHELERLDRERKRKEELERKREDDQRRRERAAR